MKSNTFMEYLRIEGTFEEQKRLECYSSLKSRMTNFFYFDRNIIVAILENDYFYLGQHILQKNKTGLV